MAKLEDAQDLGSCSERSGGSTPSSRNFEAGRQMMSYCVYVLRSQKDKRLYVGMTKNFERRFSEHNAGRVRSTKARKPLEFIYLEIIQNRQQARIREKYWKSGTGREKIQKMCRARES